ncbi:MAG: hypothetical protein ACR2OZ_01950 [Verrucomicrobiales bacterium]
MNPDIPEYRDPAWALLKQARPVPVDPFFSHNVVRCARQIESPAHWGGVFLAKIFAPRLRLVWAGVLILSGVVWWQLDQPDNAIARSAPSPLPVSTEAVPQDAIVGQMVLELALLDEIDGLLEVTEAGELNEDDVGLLLF